MFRFGNLPKTHLKYPHRERSGRTRKPRKCLINFHKKRSVNYRKILPDDQNLTQGQEYHPQTRTSVNAKNSFHPRRYCSHQTHRKPPTKKTLNRYRRSREHIMAEGERDKLSMTEGRLTQMQHGIFCSLDFFKILPKMV